MKFRPAFLALLVAATATSACAISAISDEIHLSQEQCTAADEWNKEIPYAVGDVVRYEGSIYQCIQAHTSQSDWTPDVVPALWGAVVCDGADPDQPDDPDHPDDPNDPPAGFVFSAYKDTSINMDWNTNVVSTLVPGTRTPIADDVKANGGGTITLAFATGECGSEGWGGVPGAAMAAANVPLLDANGIDFILATGGAAGSFHCGSDAGFAAFLDKWDSPHLVGVDFDIEVGQSQADIEALVARVDAAHAAHPGMRFSFTIATLANSEPGESLNATGVNTVKALQDHFGTLPAHVTVNLMTMDYGGGSPFICVVGGDGLCDMGASAIQAAENLHANHDIPLANIELTPMIGGNDVQANVFRLADVDTMTDFAVAEGLAGVHYWSWDRDVDCAPGPASPVCNSLGGAGPHGFLHRFQARGM